MKSFIYNSMGEKILDSNYLPGMTRSSSHLASMYGKDFLELVWQKGQILVQGGSSGRTPNTPSFIGHSIKPSHSEETLDEDACITKRPRLSSLNSVLDSSHQNSHQSNNQDSCQIDLRFSKSCAHSRPMKNLTREPATTENSHLCTSSSQKCLPSAPLQKPRIVSSSQTPSTNSEKQELVNFSNFSIPAVFLKSTYKGNRATWSTSNYTEKAAVAATRSKAADHSTVIESTRGSLGFQHQTALTANNSSPVSLVARSEEKPPPDEHSEAVHNSDLRIHGSHNQYYNRTSSPAALRAKCKANTNLSDEPLLASSSVCSLGASNDPNFCSKKHEDTDDSTYLSDNDEEPEDSMKETPAREGSRVKRSRNPETHNLSERKRRDKINKKMRTLKELIPNCNKVDKASMLDDAIEYLKALKLQLQILSMGTGLYMPLMMLPAAVHHMNTPNLPQLMGHAAMGFRPGIPCNPPSFPIPIPHSTTPFHH